MMPVISPMNSSGRNTTSVVNVLATIAEATSLVPSMAAVTRSQPSSRFRKMLSRTTIELSTSKPTPSASPPNEIMFRVKPLK